VLACQLRGPVCERTGTVRFTYLDIMFNSPRDAYSTGMIETVSSALPPCCQLVVLSEDDHVLQVEGALMLFHKV
jgi:hypothetical protein